MAIHKNQPSIVRNGLVLYLDAANPKSYAGSGTSWKDLSGNGYNGTLSNSPTFNAPNAGSFKFNGTNQWVDCGLSSASNVSSSCSWGAWLTPSTASAGALIRGRDGYGAGWSVSINANVGTAPWADIITTSTGAISHPVSGTTTMVANKWYYIVGVWTAGVGMATFVNGVQEGYAAFTAITLRTSTVGWEIGTYRSDLWYNGSVAIAQVYNRALSATEVLQNYNATKGRYGY